jgi:LemA protein
LSQEVREGHANIIVSMKKRIDLVNKLIDVAKGYGDHEKLTHITISKDRTESIAETKINGTLLQLGQIGSQFPELKANTTYQNLMRDLNEIESNLQNRRERYNGSVKYYNKHISSIPFVFFAQKFGFNQAEYFNITNADDLESIKDFNTPDGDYLKNTLSQIGEKGISIAKNINKKKQNN